MDEFDVRYYRTERTFTVLRRTASLVKEKVHNDGKIVVVQTVTQAVR